MDKLFDERSNVASRLQYPSRRSPLSRRLRHHVRAGRRGGAFNHRACARWGARGSVVRVQHVMRIVGRSRFR
jgi:hypothetical protein